MAEEKKTEDSGTEKNDSTGETKLSKENRALKLKIKDLYEELALRTQERDEAREVSDSIQNDLDGATTRIADLNEQFLKLEDNRDKLTVEGVFYKVVGVIETAKELVDQVHKSFVTQDSPVAVLKKI